MKPKATITALNKNLFFVLGFILFTSGVLLINWLFGLPVNRTEKFSSRIMNTESQLFLLKSMHSQFLLGFEHSGDLLISDTKTENEAGPIIGSIRKDLDAYSMYRLFKKNPAISASVSELSASLNNFENQLNDFILATREKGNESTGLIARWQALSNQMLQNSVSGHAAVSESLKQLKTFESNYLLYNKLHFLEELSATAMDIRSKLDPEADGIFVADLDSYAALTGNLMAVDKRLGNTEMQGIASNLKTGFDKLILDYNTFSELTSGTISNTGRNWKIAGNMVIFLFAIGCILFLIVITKRELTDPVKYAGDSINKIAGGEFPEINLEHAGISEIRLLGVALKQLVITLKEKSGFAHSLNDGILTATMNPAENDILGIELVELQGKIRDTAQLQQKNDEENLKRRYINEGLAKFADILRAKNNDITALGDVFIRELVKYLGAIQGGFFIYNDTDSSAPVLQLVSAFAYNRKKYLQKTLSMGEGLVGTCAMEKQVINLTEIPSGYISITSGLGDAHPDNLLLVPVLHENQLIGVLEIASLNRLKEHEIQFAGEVAGSLGATIIYTRNNERTSLLLRQSQQQALEMSEQEEEMRQNMEELKATQEESNRREEEFRGIAEAIENTLLTLEYDLEGLVRNVNDKCCIFLGRSREEIIGKSHTQIFEGTLQTDANFWDELQKNKQAVIFEKFKLGKKVYSLKEHFSTVLNRDNFVVKYISFITEMNTNG